DPVMMKFATSAANVLGKELVSSETFTWLAEHFKVSLSQCKPELEQVFLAGVNHVFYHGATYSPQEAGWPGWLFYASVQFGSNNSFWPHVTGLNEYIARCQSVLQSGNSDNDMLVYWPIYDIWNDTGRLDKQFSIHNIDDWLHPTSFYQESKKLLEKGYLLDFATDRFISEFKVEKGEIFHSEKGGKYKTLIIPKCEMMPLATLKNLLALAQKGATIIFQEMPKNVPGFHELDSRQRKFEELVEHIPFQKDDKNSMMANLGHGKIVLSNDLKEVLTELKIDGETLNQTGLQFVRRRIDGDRYYYIVNHTARKIDEFIMLNAGTNNAILMDPNSGNYGKITDAYENGKTKVWIQLPSGASMIIRCTNKNVSEIYNWKYVKSLKKPMVLEGPWKLTFSKGGPELPEDLVLDRLISWTDLPDEKAANFSGQGVYEYQFELEGELADDYLLDLGKVAESAKVWINDQEVGVLWS
ncbi:MAG: glycoside hydrolase, partial [Cyclobacteriaceae bacterium]|nr:glycoside hydrolase [Cyclobacteriaceae bacterium]